MENFRNAAETYETYDYWIDSAQMLKNYLKTTEIISPEVSSEYESKLKAYEETVDELKARRSSFSKSPMLEYQADELLNEFEENKNLFKRKLTSFYF